MKKELPAIETEGKLWESTKKKWPKKKVKSASAKEGKKDKNVKKKGNGFDEWSVSWP